MSAHIDSQGSAAAACPLAGREFKAAHSDNRYRIVGEDGEFYVVESLDGGRLSLYWKADAEALVKAEFLGT
jgi:hypothetical protein